MRILIAGGTGRIGKPLIRALISSGHKVVVLSRSASKISATSEISRITWDGKTTTGWGGILNEIEVVVNLAGETIGSFPWTPKRKKKFRDSRLDAGHALVSAIRDARERPKIFIQASAVGFYGSRGYERVDEATGPGDGFSAKLCCDWESSTEEVEVIGVRRIIIRTGIVLENNGGVLPLMVLPVKLFVGGRMGSGEQGIPWIHIDDEVQAIRFLLEDETAQGVYNLSAPTPVSNAEFIKVMAKVLNRPYWFHVPENVIRFALGEMSTLLLDGQYVIPKRLSALGFKFRYDTIESAAMGLFGGWT
jgi:uncharacterized protein